MTSSLDDAYEYCRRLTKERAKNFYYASITLPREQRKAIYAAYAFCRHCDDYSDDDLAYEQKLVLLAGYRESLAKAFDETPSDPLFSALRDTAEKYHIPKKYFDEIISGVEMDLSLRRYRTFDDLFTYCYRVAAVVGLICVQIFGYKDPRAQEYAVDLGVAMQLANILRDIKEDAGRDRIYIPQEDLQRFGYSEQDLLRGMINQPFVEMMRFEVERARDYFERGSKLLPLLPLRSRACPAVLRGIYKAVLGRIEQGNYDVYSQRMRLRTREKLRLTGRIWVGTWVKGLLTAGKLS
ncbi:MAG: phytoene/squalene synthase family protein [Chloroflexi bacterium]|nr:phytoene/squalene synthase family protein [Chloroflexota bacterium]